MALTQPLMPPRQAPRERSLTQDLRDNTDVNKGEDITEEKDCLPVDFLEWWCYKLIGGKTPKAILKAEGEMIKGMEDLGDNQCNFGRLCNRIELAALSWDIFCLGQPDLIEKENAQRTVAEHWRDVREELILSKSKLLRQDANADVVLLSEEEQMKQQKAIPCFQRERSPLFQSQYTDVVTLVRVQQSLNVFAEELRKLVGANTATINEGENKRKVREAIEEYETQINLLFSPPSNKASSEDDDASVHSSSSDVRALPQELAGFLLKDLYQTSANANKHQGGSSSPTESSTSSTSPSTALAERLLSRVESIVHSASSKYSQSSCQTASRQLLLEWHDLVLEQPALVRLGYGEKPGSSRARKAHDAEDAMLRRLSNDQASMMQDIADMEASGFRPIQWVDSDSEGSVNLPDPAPLEETHTNKRSRSKSPRKRGLSTSITLYSDSEDDPEESPQKKSRKRGRSTEAPTRLRISQTEEDAILEGVRKYGLGRWNIVKQQANGALDQLSPQKIKVAYQQTMRKNRISRSPTTMSSRR